MREVGLHGRLADFTLEEILQLIALQQKTGLLTVDAAYPMVLAFESGMLVGYRDRRRNGTDPLESFLKRYGFFPTESWEHIDFVAHNSSLDLTEILVNEGLLSAEELAQIQQEAAQEDIFRGMQLRDGRYHFLPGRDGLAGLKGRVRLKVDGLLMEAVRRIDEIAGLRDRYFSNDLKIRLGPEEFEASARSAAERRVLALLGEENTLGRIVAGARMSEFDTLSTLEQLREAGIVVVQSAPRERPDDESVTEERSRWALEGPTLRLWIGALVAVALGFTLVLAAPWSAYRTAGDDDPSARLQSHRERARVMAAIELFELDRHRPPKQLEDLVHAGWIDVDLLERIERTHRYELRGTRWTLQPRSVPPSSS